MTWKILTMKIIFVSTWVFVFTASAAFAGVVAPSPLPLAGVIGPFGFFAAAAGYGVYRAAKYFRQ